MAMIRAAVEADIPAVVGCVEALMRELGDPDDRLVPDAFDICRMFMARPGNAVYVAVAEADSRSHDHSICGAMTLEQGLTLYAGGVFGTIRELYVLLEHRSRGVGHELIRRAIEHGRSHGWRRIEVTAPDMPRWLRTKVFYEREGFVDAGPKLKLVVSP